MRKLSEWHFLSLFCLNNDENDIFDCWTIEKYRSYRFLPNKLSLFDQQAIKNIVLIDCGPKIVHIIVFKKYQLKNIVLIVFLTKKSFKNVALIVFCLCVKNDKNDIIQSIFLKRLKTIFEGCWARNDKNDIFNRLFDEKW